MARRGHKTLLIDCDPQGNATSGLGKDKNYLNRTIYDVLIKDVPISDAIIRDCRENLDLCPSNITLASAEIELVPFVSRETILKEQSRQ